MIFPSIDKLLEKVDSKYSLVIAAAKRARSIKKGDNVLVKFPKSKKYVGIALEEIDSTEIIIKSRLV